MNATKGDKRDIGTSGKDSEKSVETAIRLVDLVKGLIRELHPREKVEPGVGLDSELDRDLGFDSLGRVELLSRAERAFGVAIPEQAIGAIETVRDLLREILRAEYGAKPSAPPEVEQVEIERIDSTPLSAATLPEVLEWHVSRHPNRPHIRFYSDEGEGETISHEELYLQADRIARGLQAVGLQPLETVMIMLPTGKDYFFSFFGTIIAGGIPVPVYPPGQIRQIEEHLRRHAAIAGNCLAAIMITLEEALPFARVMHTQAPKLRRLVTPDALLEAVGKEREGEGGRPIISRDDIAFLQYTSGSTGMPKGVVLSHANLLANIRAMGKVLEVESTDVFVSWLPLYHDMGLIGAWFGSLYHGCQLVIMPSLSFIARPERWLRAIHRWRGTLSAAPNFAYELCLRRLGDEDLSGLDLGSWRCAFNGAEAVSPATVGRFIERFKDYGFKAQAMMPVYGLAECSVGLAFPPLGRGPVTDRIKRGDLVEQGMAIPADDVEKDHLSFVNCGRPLPGHEIRIIDETGRELPDRRQGRLQFRGPSATSGYYRNPEKTRELFQDGWLQSGDMAYMADGEIYITGRGKDIIIRAGRNIYPEELEEAVGAVEGIRRGGVAVFGRQDAGQGTERLVVLAETRKKDPAIREKLRARVNAKVTDLVGLPPDEVVLAPPNTVLRTSSGKIRRGATRDLYLRGKVGVKGSAVWWQIVRFTFQGTLSRMRGVGRLLSAWFYSGYVWLLIGAAAPFLWIATVMLPSEGRRWKALEKILHSLIRLAGLPFRAEGLDNLPPPDSPCVYVSNHASYLDGFLLAGVLGRPVSFIAKAELRRSFFAGLPLARLGTVFVERFDAQRSASHARMLREKAGQSLLFFSEGTFTRMAGLLPFRMGAFETAVARDMPVIPIAVRGTRSALRSGSWLFRRVPVRITIGEPIDTGGIKKEAGDDAWKAALLLRDMTRAWILQRCGEPDLRDERPAIFDKGGSS